MRREVARPSLRQLAEAAGVTIPTLRHYFGSRAEIVDAILEEYRRAGDARLKTVASEAAPFAESVQEFAQSLIRGMSASRPVRLGDVFAVSLAEGLLDPQIGASALRHIVDPAIEALQMRLSVHIARGEMIDTDTRAAALMLISPILIAVLHQDQMGGAACNPMDVDKAAASVASAFVRAYAVSGSARAGRELL